MALYEAEQKYLINEDLWMMDYGLLMIKPFQPFPHIGIAPSSMEPGQPEAKIKRRPNLSLTCSKLVSLPASLLSTCSTLPTFFLLST
jgi:hypothetical protein